MTETETETEGMHEKEKKERVKGGRVNNQTLRSSNENVKLGVFKFHKTYISGINEL